MLGDCCLILEPVSSSEDFCVTQAGLVHLLSAPPVVSVCTRHLRRSHGLWGAAQSTVGITRSVQPRLPLGRGLTDASLAFAAFSDVKACDPVTSEPHVHCPALTSSHNPTFSGTGGGRRAAPGYC